MAITLRAACASFRVRLVLANTEAAVVAERAAQISAAVAHDLPVAEQFFVGSYARQTLTPPLAQTSVDLALVLRLSPRRITALALRDTLHQALRRQYAWTAISPTGQGVTVASRDIAVTVLPLLNPWAGVYLLPTRTGEGWLTTNPQRHVALAQAADAASGGRLLPAVRLLRCWNRTAGQPLHGFHLEALAWALLEPQALADTTTALMAVWAGIPARLAAPLPDPAGFDGDLGAYLTPAQRTVVVRRCANARAQLRRATEYEHAGASTAALAACRSLFGPLFPRDDEPCGRGCRARPGTVPTVDNTDPHGGGRPR